MRRLLYRYGIPAIFPLFLTLTACGSSDGQPDASVVNDPAAQCLVAAGYVPIAGTSSTVSFQRGEDEPMVRLGTFDGVLQPVGSDDLDAFTAAGCG